MFFMTQFIVLVHSHGRSWNGRGSSRFDLSPSDYYLFRSLEHWLRGKKFNTIEEMRESLTEFFASKDRDWYRRGIHQLEEQLQKVIESGGEYFE
uniref:Uncharacterized protein n=1 Tax=Acrobeloides nanus TaxID=290746 RepID=A0A914ENP3_9BILA